MSLAQVPTFPFFGKSAYAEPIHTEVPQETETLQPRLKLFRGSEDAGHYVSSPFVTKVEFRLRLADVDYDLGAGAPWLGPKGKIPYLELQAELKEANAKPTMLGDSALITRHLIADGMIQDLNASLTPSEKTQDLALRSLLEDKLYFYHMHECWIENFYLQRDQALWSIPLPIRVLVGRSVHGKVTRTLYGQGVGRLTLSEIDGLRREIWHGFEDLLLDVQSQGENANSREPFWLLGGSSPTEADVTVFGFVASIMSAPSCPGSQALLRSLPTVMNYAGRIHETYFGDYVKWSDDVHSNAKL